MAALLKRVLVEDGKGDLYWPSPIRAWQLTDQNNHHLEDPRQVERWA